MADRAYIINKGKTMRVGFPRELTNDLEVKKAHFGKSFILN